MALSWPPFLEQKLRVEDIHSCRTGARGMNDVSDIARITLRQPVLTLNCVREFRRSCSKACTEMSAFLQLLQDFGTRSGYTSTGGGT
eukprot:2655709-Amphidinium_carterae.1